MAAAPLPLCTTIDLVNATPGRLSVGAVNQHPPTSILSYVCPPQLVEVNQLLNNSNVNMFEPTVGPGSWRFRRLFGTESPLAWQMV